MYRPSVLGNTHLNGSVSSSSAYPLVITTTSMLDTVAPQAPWVSPPMMLNGGLSSSVAPRMFFCVCHFGRENFNLFLCV
jgi:hypothetical protein